MPNQEQNSSPVEAVPSVLTYFEKIKKLWNDLPTPAVVLYVLLLCCVYQLTYWDQFGVNFLEFMSVSEAAGRSAVPLALVFVSLIVVLSLDCGERPKRLLNLNRPLHRWLHVAMRVALGIGAVALIAFNVLSPVFLPLSFCLIYVPVLVCSGVLVATPSTAEAQEKLRLWPHWSAVLWLSLSYFFSAIAGNLVGACKTFGSDHAEVVFVDPELRLRLWGFRYVDTIGGMHVFISVYPSTRTALVEASQVRSIIFSPRKYNPRQFADAERAGNGLEEYLVALNALANTRTEADITVGFSYLLKAAKAGNVSAKYQVAVCYWKGRGIEPDLQSHLDWLEEAAKSGSSDAQLLLGLRYSKGEGVLTNKEKAFGYFSDTAIGGNEDARKLMPLLYDSGSGVPVDRNKANAWRVIIGERPEPADVLASNVSRAAEVKEIELIRVEIAKRSGR